MKILVCVKRVIDYNVRVRVRADGMDVETANVKMSTNPFDEIALEEAVRLKEKGQAAEVVAVTIGAEVAQDVLRTALALGADRAIHIVTDQPVQPLQAARLLAAIAARESPGLIITGKQAIDDDCNQTGQMLAGLLGWGQGTFASQVALEESAATVTRETDGGHVTVKLKLPAVVTTDLRLNTPRYATLPNIMKARSKPIEKLTPQDLNVDTAPGLVRLKVEEPARRSGGKKLATVEELAAVLKTVI